MELTELEKTASRLAEALQALADKEEEVINLRLQIAKLNLEADELVLRRLEKSKEAILWKRRYLELLRSKNKAPN